MTIRREKNPQRKVFVVGTGSTAFLSIIRSLGRKGIVVHVANDNTTDLAFYSRYITQVHRISSSSDPDKRRSDIVRIMKEERFDLVIPAGDQNVIPFQIYRSEYEQWGRVYALDENAFQIVNSKALTGQLAQSLGISVPRSEIVSSCSDTSAILEKFSLPVILKPVSSFTAENLMEKRQVKRADTPQQFERVFRTMLLHGPVIVQEYFDGTGLGMEILAYQGKILTRFQHIRIHEEGKSIGSTYRKSQPVDAQVLALTEKLIAALAYSGVAMIEFRYNPEKKALVLIEINGRFWGSLPLPLACGIDFPFFLYQMIIEGRRDFPQDYRTGIYCRNTTADLQWVAATIFSKNDAGSSRGYSLLRYISEFGNIFLFRERNDVFVIDDPVPGVIELWRLFRKACAAIQRKILKKNIQLPTTRHHGPEDLHSVLRSARSILFVCYGNICRSPFAEAYLKPLVPPDIRITSCGYYPIDGRLCPVEAVASAKKFGIDLTSHRSRVANDAVVRSSDIIFAFDHENIRKITGDYPGIEKKVWYLSEATEQYPVNIPDPYGKDLIEFEKVYDVIAGHCNAIASQINDLSVHGDNKIV